MIIIVIIIYILGLCEKNVFAQAVNNQNQNQFKMKTGSLDLDKNDKEKVEPTRPGRRLGVLKNQPFMNPPTKVMLVWLESYEDHITFPVG